MSTSCEKVSRYILPIYRSIVARELIEKHDYTQVSAAKKIGTTQAAISQYVTSKRGNRSITNFDEIAPLVRKAAAQIAERIAKEDMSPEEFSESFCQLCTQLRKEKKIS